MKKTLIIALLSLFTCIALADAVYRWTDANGVVHYSDSPSNQDAQVVNITKPTPVTSNVPQPQISSENSAPSSSSSAPSAAETEQAAAAQKQTAAYCAQAKNNLSTLQVTGRRVYTVTPSGQYHYFSEQERQTQIQQIQQNMKLNCPG
ncbi:MAG: DUF4124 domain-containing protein [Gammaproteobacteria bacterium]|nr:DUF4124 domain-containing protein [Gammaproteobacteria bacterium]